MSKQTHNYDYTDPPMTYDEEAEILRLHDEECLCVEDIARKMEIPAFAVRTCLEIWGSHPKFETQPEESA